MNAVALVNVDLDVPHLDHPFEYEIPEALAGDVRVGSRVQVVFSGRMKSGWITGLAPAPQSGRKLQPIKRVVGPFPLVTAGLLRTADYLSTRYATNLKQILSFAVPVRRAHVEKQFEGMASHTGGTDAAVTAPATRAVASLYPGQMLPAIETAVKERQDGESLAIVLPTSAQVRRVLDHLQASFPELKVAGTTVDDSDAARYRVHLRALLGELDVIVGTRSAVWTPLPRGGSIIIWDDGDDRLRDPRAPRLDALDVAVARSHVEHTGLLAIGYARSVKDQALIDSGWAVDTSPDREAGLELVPTTRIHDWVDAEREGASGRSRLPDAAFRMIRESIQVGPVLVQVAAAGYETELPCPGCGEVLANGQSVEQAGVAQVRAESCTHPSHRRGRRIRVGSDRIRDELARAFPGVPVLVSSSTAGLIRSVPGDSAIVVATTSAEPIAERGYSAVLIAEAESVAYLDALDAQMEAERRMMGALALARPGADAMIIGSLPDGLEQSLIRWQPGLLAAQELRTRVQLGFPPARWVATVTGTRDGVAEAEQAIEALQSAPGAATGRGTAAMPAAATPVAILSTFVNSANQTERTAIFSCSPRAVSRMMGELRAVQVARSAAGKSLLRIECNPGDLIDVQPN